MTSGQWASSAALQSEGAQIPLSSRAAVSLKDKQTLFNVDGHKQNSAFVRVNATEETGWWGTISKTTDGGQTWETVFQSAPTDTYYFNSIACSSEVHCVAVTEGADSVDDCKAFVTFDGGDTWTNALEGVVPSDSVSLMVRCHRLKSCPACLHTCPCLANYIYAKVVSNQCVLRLFIHGVVRELLG